MTEELPEGWCWATVEQLVSSTDYGTSAKTNEDPDGIPVLRMGNIVDGALSLTNLKYLPADHDEFPKLLLQPGDLLFNRTNSPELVGKSAVYTGSPKQCSFASYLIRLKSQGMLPYLLAAYINSPYGRAWVRSVVQQQVGQANVNGSRLLALKVPVPPLAEQRRIVAKIEGLTARSRATRAALAEVPTLLEQFRQSVLASAFRGDLTAHWRAKHPDAEPASVLLARIRDERRKQWEAKYPKKKYAEPAAVDDSELPELPEGWCWVTLDEVSTKITDGVHRKPSYVPSGIPFLTVKNLTAGPGLSFSDTNFVALADHEEFIRRTHPEKGDVLVTKDGTLGTVRVIETDTPFSIFVSLALVKVIPLLDSHFLAHAIESPHGQSELKATGSGLQHIHLIDLRVARIPLAPRAEQLEISRLLRQFFNDIDRHEQMIAELLTETGCLDQSITAKAFRGELVPQDPADEPASVLLERIRREREAGTNGTAAATKKRRTKTQ